MGQNTMNRVIHAAVRRDFARMAEALGSFTDGDQDRASALGRAWDNVQGQLVHHHEQEDTLIWPVLAKAGFDVTLLAEMESEHHTMAESLAHTTTCVHRLSASGSAVDAASAGESLTTTRAVTERHLAHEEAELEPLLVPFMQRPEWAPVQKKLQGGSPVQSGWFFAWLLDGADPADESYVRAQVPAPVVFVLTRVFGRGYRRSVASVWQS